jgi:SAM-dependent methyltransferase
MQTLKKARERFLDRHPHVDDRWNRWFSAGTYSHFRRCSEMIREHARGRTLDVGAGRGGWQKVLEAAGVTYESLERSPRGAFRPTHQGDVLDMAAVEDDGYDTLYCSQVLEHVAEPERALLQMKRKLRPDGKLLLSVPHLARRHELPHDYFRYTQEGARALLERTGFEVLEVSTYGGILSLLHHQASVLALGATIALPGVGAIALAANAPLAVLLPRVDDAVDRARLLPLGVVAVARRPAR